MKSKDLIDKIVKADNKTSALETLYDILKSLHLTNNYTELVKVKNNLDQKKEDFKRITNAYNIEDKNIDNIINCRQHLNFLYRDIVDEFSFTINKNKIYFEEARGTIKADSYKNLQENQELIEEFGLKSKTALKDFLHYSEIYREYTANYSIAYALYKELDGLLNSIKQFIDLLSGQIRLELNIQTHDAK